MQFTHDTEVALALTAALVNTHLDGVEHLVDIEALSDFARQQASSGSDTVTVRDLRAVRALRRRLAEIWDADNSDDVVTVVNEIFTGARALPRLTTHDDWGWHLHFTSPDAPLAERLGTYAAMGLADLVRAEDLDRLKRCDADDCTAVLVDLSRNRSRSYCDTGNCANRVHVAAYRARKTGRGAADR